jgi:transcriptional regulator with PAS, ATPase and Fis domain
MPDCGRDDRGGSTRFQPPGRGWRHPEGRSGAWPARFAHRTHVPLRRPGIGAPAGRGGLLVRLPGRSVSSIHARFRRSESGWVVTDAGSTNGTYVNGTRVTERSLASDDVIEIGRTFLVFGSAYEPADQPATDLDSRTLEDDPAFATLDVELDAELSTLRRLAVTDITISLCGETGTGKEVLSTAIHRLSQRPGPLIAINCGAIPETLVESQLFGHVRGAFSGAISDTSGFLRAADRGTVLLDEAQDLSRPAQAALLRVLQQREVVPVGSARAVPVQLRFLATSPVALNELVSQGRMRADLQSRLQGVTHELLPLRDRRQDLGVLVAAVLRRLGVTEADNPSLSLEFANSLFRYDFPLNIRELEQLLARGWALSEQNCVALDFTAQSSSREQTPEREGVDDRELSESEIVLRNQLRMELERERGNVAAVARTLGKAPMQIRRWLRRYSIDPESFRGSAPSRRIRD